jgi:SAM-dependent methyltransferase
MSFFRRDQILEIFVLTSSLVNYNSMRETSPLVTSFFGASVEIRDHDVHLVTRPSSVPLLCTGCALQRIPPLFHCGVQRQSDSLFITFATMVSQQEDSSQPVMPQVWQIIERGSATGIDPETRKELRQMYSDVADLYHEFRPRYPEALIDEAIAKSELLVSNPNARILEIGCGPGTLTLPLAQRGYDVVAIDPGSGMIAKAREVCQDYSNVEFHNETFKDYLEKADSSFDAIIAATSLHWALAGDDKPAMIEKMAGLLKQGGNLLLFWNLPPEPDDAVLDAVAEASGCPKPFYFGNASPETHWERMQEHVLAPVETSGLFSKFETTAIPLDEKIPVEGFISFLSTLSNYITMESQERETFFQIVRETFHRLHDGVVPTSRKSILNISLKWSN